MSIESSNLQLLVHHHAAIYVQGLARDVGAAGRGQEQDGIGDIVALAQASQGHLREH